MNLVVRFLQDGLSRIQSRRDFESWVRTDLRKVLPHSAFLGTLGSLYNVGSVPTHRLNVDFPPNIIEEQKNSAGAIDDPMMFEWFRSGQMRFVVFDGSAPIEKIPGWKGVVADFGLSNILLHGALDHAKRRFATFQVVNLEVDCDVPVFELFNLILADMVKAAWETVDRKASRASKFLVGHPTSLLTPAEIETVGLLAQGLSNKEIARYRGVSDSTVKTQVSRTGAKLGATHRAEIVAVAMPLLTRLPAQTLVVYEDEIGRQGKGLQ